MRLHGCGHFLAHLRVDEYLHTHSCEGMIVLEMRVIKVQCKHDRKHTHVHTQGSRYKLDGQDAPFLTRNINKDDRYKKKKITKAKKEIQYREIKECTFRPKINKTHPSQPTGTYISVNVEVDVDVVGS